MIAQLDRDFLAASASRSAARLLSYMLFEGRPLTTRGQWVNPVVLRHLRLAASYPFRDRLDRPVFVVGMGRSGTTLLARILGVHPAVGFLNEPKALWYTVTERDDIIGTYGADPGLLRLGPEHATADAVAAAHRIMSWYLCLTRSKRLVDKYPEIVFRTEFVRAIFPDAIFVVIVRRGFDAISSVARWSADHRQADADWWGLNSRKWRVLWEQAVLPDPANRAIAAEIDPETTDETVRAAVEWVVTMREVGRVRSALDSAIVFVRYEDLVDDPARSVPEILLGCGLDPSPAVLEFARRSVRRVREPVRSIPDLPPAIAAAIEETTSDLGYH